MAALTRPTQATYVIHDNVTVDTNDHEDHTFCGIMFPVKCKDLLPLDHVVIHNVSVRGRLGPLTVWVSNLDEEYAVSDDGTSSHHNTNNVNRSFRMNKKYWTKLYERTHPPSFRQYQDLDLRPNPIILKPGQVRAVYIHSALHGDEGIVYDNRHGRRTYDDALISILPGRAHVSPKAFSAMPIWGWGNAWRDHREFVGRIEFGAVYKLWNPMAAPQFGSQFQTLVRTLFLCQRKWESPMSMLPDDCIFYILNMCRWDWAGDKDQNMKDLKRRRKKRQAEEAAAAAAEARAAAYVAANRPSSLVAASLTAARSNALGNGTATATATATTTTTSSTTVAAASCCSRSPCRGRSDDHEDNPSDEEEEFHSAEEKEDDDDDDDDDNDIQSDTAGNVNEQDSEYIPDEVQEDEWDSDAEEDEDEEDQNDSDEWDSDDAYHASNDVFTYRDDDSDDDGQNNVEAEERNRRAWIRRQFARIHVLQALADVNGNAVMELDF